MQTFIGVGTGDAYQAFNQATKGLTMPNIIIFESTRDDIKTVSKLIKEAYPNAMSIGTVSEVKFVDTKIVKKGLTILALFNDTEVSCGVIKQLSSAPVLYINSLKKSIEDVDAGHENTICLEFCTGYEERLMTTMSSCLKDIPLIGSTAFSNFDFTEPYVALNGKIYDDACVYAVIKNKTGKIKVYNENIYKLESAQFHIATEVSKDSRTIKTLDGKKASDVYCSAIGIKKEDIMDNALFHPFGRLIKDKIHISAIRGLNEDGSMEVLNRINKNSLIYILTPDEYEFLERKNIEKIKKHMKNISLILAYDCMHRYKFYKNEGYLDTYLKNLSELGPYFSMIGAGEQYNARHMNQSMVCAVFE